MVFISFNNSGVFITFLGIERDCANAKSDSILLTDTTRNIFGSLG